MLLATIPFDMSIKMYSSLLEINESNDERKVVAADGFDEPWQDVDMLQGTFYRDGIQLGISLC